MKRTSDHVKNTWIKQLCNHKVRDFAMAFGVSCPRTLFDFILFSLFGADHCLVSSEHYQDTNTKSIHFIFSFSKQKEEELLRQQQRQRDHSIINQQRQQAPPSYVSNQRSHSWSFPTVCNHSLSVYIKCFVRNLRFGFRFLLFRASYIFFFTVLLRFYNIDRTLRTLWLVKNPCFIRV